MSRTPVGYRRRIPWLQPRQALRMRVGHTRPAFSS
jgi:hypothetical protein